MATRHFLALAMGWLIILAAVAGVSGLAQAQALTSPTGEVVLTVDGAIANQNAEGRADFDIAMIRTMPSVKFSTSTPWTDGQTEFEGVLVKDVLEAVDWKGKSLKAAALNDYIVDLDVDTLVSGGAILAYRVNGADISVREKGPLWIMFPFDDRPELKNEAVFSQSVWQLRRLTSLQ
jgi:hypothetical protein